MGGYSIGTRNFVVLEDSTSSYHDHFPPDTYAYDVRLLTLMRSITDDVVSREDVEHQHLIGAKTCLAPRQSGVIASFAATHPSVLDGPNEGHAKSVDFPAMKSFEEWDKENARHGLTVILTHNITSASAEGLSLQMPSSGAVVKTTSELPGGSEPLQTSSQSIHLSLISSALSW